MISQGDEVGGAWLRRLVDAVPAAIGYWDAELRCVFANRALGMWLGRAPHALKGMSLRDVWGQDVFDAHEPHIRSALEGGPTTFECAVSGPAGIRRECLVHLILDLAGGIVQGLTIELNDVTALKRTEADLRAAVTDGERVGGMLNRSETALREAQRLGQIGSWEWEAAADITIWSEQLYRIFGLDPSRLPPGFTDHPTLYAPDSWARLQGAVATALETGRPYVLELEYVRSDGVRGWLEARGEATRDETGAIVGLHGTAQEISAHRMLRQARGSTRVDPRPPEGDDFGARVLRSSPCVQYVYDVESHRCVYINGSVAAVLGFDADAIVSMGDDVVRLLMHPEDVPRFVAHVERLAAATGDDVVALDHRMRNSSGGWNRFRSIDRVFERHPDGSVSRIVGVAVDITGQSITSDVGDRDRGLASTPIGRFKQSVLDALPAHIAVVDTDGRIVAVNRSWKTFASQNGGGSDAAVFIGASYRDACRQARGEEASFALGALAGLDDVLAGRSRSFQLEYPCHGAGGIEAWYLMHVMPADLSSGGLGAVISHLDITERRKVEDDLRRSTERLTLGVRLAGLALADIDYARNSVELAPEAAAMFGLPLDTRRTTRDHIHAMFHPDDAPALWPLIEASHDPAGDGVIEAEHRLVLPSGRITWHAVRKQVVFDRSQAYPYPRYALLALRDITASKIAEEALKQNERFLARLVEQAPMGMYVVDSDLRFRQVNRLAAPVFASIDPLIGRPLAEVLEILWGADVGRFCTDIFRNTLVTGERYVSPVFVEQRADLGVQQAFDWETQRVAFSDGRYGVVCYFRDVTERDQVQRALGRSEERFRLATQAGRVGVWEWHVPSGRIHWNDEMFGIYGIEPTLDGMVPYEAWRGAVVPEDIEAQEALVQVALRDKGPLRQSFRIRRRGDGALRYIEGSATVRQDDVGEATHVIGTNLDLTDARVLQEELETADKRKNDFIAMLAHELRNPLAPIRTSVAILGREQSGSPVVRRAHETIERQLSQMVRLVDDLMDVSRISRDKIELRLEPVDLRTVVQHALEAGMPHAEAAGLRLDVHLPAAPVMVSADPLRLAQVFGNLLNNASKFTPSGGRIEVRMSEAGGDAVVTVADTGVGISSAMLKRVFDLFTQSDRPGDRMKGGLGIGLALARRLTEMHGGGITVDSPGEGRGATFTVRIPRSAAVTALAGDEPSDARPGNTACRVLVVDDNVDGAESLALLLSIEGFDARIAHDGHRALVMAESWQPDVVLLDLGLPGVDGLEVCRRIRREPWGRTMRIYAVTGWGQDTDRRLSEAAGCNGHLVKPVEASMLIRLLSA